MNNYFTRYRLFIALVSGIGLSAMWFAPDAISQGTLPVAPPEMTVGDVSLAPSPPVDAPDDAPSDAASDDDSGGYELKFDDSPIEMLLQDYGDTIGRTLLLSPGLPKANVILRSHKELSQEEYLEAIETVLTMYGIALLPEGDKFIRVVPVKAARQEPMPILEEMGEEPHKENSAMVSQVIQLRHIEVAEAVKAIEPLKHTYGTVQVFERNNSLLVTDSAATVNRIVQIMRYVDVAVEARETLHIVPIQFAKAADIKKKLEEIIAESLEEQKKKSVIPQTKESGQPGVVTPSPATRLSSVIRARSVLSSTNPDGSGGVEVLEEEGQKGIIRGDVKMVADDRTNILIIITRPENMTLFFNDIIRVLDKATAPDVMVEVFRLEFADAKEIAAMLNELIGAASKDEAAAATDKSGGAADKGSAALSEFVKRQPTQEATAGVSKVGELSKDNIKVMADERTNALVIMGREGDIAALKAIIDDVDMMLSQVLIESVIMEIDLSDSLSTGVDWVQRSMVGYSGKSDGDATMTFAGGGGGGSGDPRSGGSFTSSESLSGLGSGLTYYMSFLDLNVDMIVQAAATDSRSKIISTPVILTTDNTEATIKFTDKIYVLDSVTRRSSSTTSLDDYNNYSKEDVGLELKVKPRINKNRVVMLEVEQVLSEPNANAQSDVDQLAGTKIYTERRIEANVAVESGQTIVLGGQVREKDGKSGAKIPILGDIPFLGRLFSSRTRSRGRTETVVFLTPYVLDTPSEITAESRRRKESLTDDGLWKRGWSASKLAAPADGELIHDEAFKDLEPAPKQP